MRRPAFARLSGPSGAATLLAVLVALGVLAAPVECARAAGPHSVFVAAADIARLQTGDADPGAADGGLHGADPAAHAHHEAMPSVHADHPAAHPPAHDHIATATHDVARDVAPDHLAPAPAIDPAPKAVRVDAARESMSGAPARAVKALPAAAPASPADDRAGDPSGLAHHAAAALASVAALAPARLSLAPPDPDGARLLFVEPAGFLGRPLPGPEAPPP